MTGPYRTPASIDPPLEALGAAELRRWVRAVSGAAIVFLVTASAAFTVLIRDLDWGHRAHGAVRPPAHRTAVAPAPPPAPIALPRPPTPPPAIDDAPLIFFQPESWIGTAGPPTHQPDELWARAKRLAARGDDLTLTETTLSPASIRDLEAGLPELLRVAFQFRRGGVVVRSLQQGGAAALVGLAAGDVLVAVNGHALAHPEAVLTAYESARAAKIAVLEILRGGRRIALRLSLR